MEGTTDTGYLMEGPKLLMLEEPSLGHAPHFLDLILKFFKEINQQGLTLFIVEPEVPLALNCSKRRYL